MLRSLLSSYGCFLIVRTASTTPIMIITIITAAIPNSRLPVDAKPVGGDGYGDAVGEALITLKVVSPFDGQ